MESKSTEMDIKRKKKKKARKIEETQQYIFALKQMVSREIKRKYARSYLGIVWSVLNPLMTMAVMSLIFSSIFKRSIENFPIYYLTGQILWGFFSQATTSAMTSLVDNKSLLLKVKLSKQTFILSRVLTALANLGYTLLAYVFMLIVFRVKISFTMLLFPLVIILLLLFTTGLSYILAIAYVFFGDIKYLYSVILTIWMYMCALFYPADSVAPIMQRIISVNPLYSYIQFARECVMYQKVPDAIVWLKMVGWSIGVFVVGYYVYRRKENSVMQKV